MNVDKYLVIKNYLNNDSFDDLSNFIFSNFSDFSDLDNLDDSDDSNNLYNFQDNESGDNNTIEKNSITKELILIFIDNHYRYFLRFTQYFLSDDFIEWLHKSLCTILVKKVSLDVWIIESIKDILEKYKPNNENLFESVSSINDITNFFYSDEFVKVITMIDSFFKSNNKLILLYQNYIDKYVPLLTIIFNKYYCKSLTTNYKYHKKIIDNNLIKLEYFDSINNELNKLPYKLISLEYFDNILFTSILHWLIELNNNKLVDIYLKNFENNNNFEKLLLQLHRKKDLYILCLKSKYIKILDILVNNDEINKKNRKYFNILIQLKDLSLLNYVDSIPEEFFYDFSDILFYILVQSTSNINIHIDKKNLNFINYFLNDYFLDEYFKINSTIICERIMKNLVVVFDIFLTNEIKVFYLHELIEKNQNVCIINFIDNINDNKSTIALNISLDKNKESIFIQLLNKKDYFNYDVIINNILENNKFKFIKFIFDKLNNKESINSEEKRIKNICFNILSNQYFCNNCYICKLKRFYYIILDYFGINY